MTLYFLGDKNENEDLVYGTLIAFLWINSAFYIISIFNYFIVMIGIRCFSEKATGKLLSIAFVYP
jgi:hypothetical protein